MKTIDVPEHFKTPKLLKELSGYSFIPAKKLNLDGFKKTNSNKFYLEADKNGIEIVKDKESAKLIISKKWYHEIEDPKKRLVVTKVKCKIPELHKGFFKAQKNHINLGSKYLSKYILSLNKYLLEL